jgi:prepilin-type N-terminal cleavage/methylation domain-containing protein
MRKKGFTLAEVLITLSIIGVVAALTIPGIVHDFQETEQKVAWKKAFSMASQAGLALTAEHGGDLSGAFNDADDTKNAHYIVSALEGYMGGYTRTCFGDCLPTSIDCFSNFKAPNNQSYGVCTASVPFAAALLKNGMSITVRSPSSGCGTAPDWDCFDMWVDINGMKGPGIVGKDIYSLSITRNGRALPNGWNFTDDAMQTGFWGCNSHFTDWGCSAWYLRQ